MHRPKASDKHDRKVHIEKLDRVSGNAPWNGWALHPQNGLRDGGNKVPGPTAQPMWSIHGQIPVTTPPLAQARPRSQKSGQNGSSTPTPCLDKAVHARDTCDSKARAGLEPHSYKVWYNAQATLQIFCSSLFTVGGIRWIGFKWM